MKEERRNRKKPGQLILDSIMIAIFVLLVGQFSVSPVAAFAASPTVMDNILASPNAESFGQFGISVATSGNIVVVGAPFETANGEVLAGHAYTFNAETGALVSSLTSPNPQPSGLFGWSVAATGNIVVVGALEETVNGQYSAGHAYTFNAETGALIGTLTSPNAQPAGAFGWSVAARGSVLVVGARGESVNGQVGAGHAYKFSVETGALLSTLTSPTPQSLGNFGESVATSGNVLVVGAVGESDNRGHVYTFNAETGALISTLTSPNAQPAGDFGVSVAASGNVLVVGAVGETVNRLIAGRAYSFDAETGALISTLTSPNLQSFGLFGQSVAASGNVLVVGAFSESDSRGHVYTFNTETGALISTLTSPNAQRVGFFGWSVAARGNVLVVGAPFETGSGQGFAGNAYIS